MKFKVAKMAILLTCIAGCGSAPKSKALSKRESTKEISGETSAPLGSMAVADASKVPTCDAAHEGGLVYILSDKIFQTCSAGTWSTIDIAPQAGVSSGSTGAAYVYDAKGIQLGTVISSDFGSNVSSDVSVTMRISNGAIGRFPLGSGVIFYYDSNLPNTCFYTTADCSGQCYSNTGKNGIALKGLLVGGPNKELWVQSGTEVSSNIKPLSVTSRGACYPGSNGLESIYAIPVSARYTFPSGITYPFAAPMRLVQ